MYDIPMPEPRREMTDEDFYALMASDLWLDKQDLTPYLGRWVAVLGEKVIDSDPDEEALALRIVALGHTIDQYKVLTRYLGGPDDPIRVR